MAAKPKISINPKGLLKNVPKRKKAMDDMMKQIEAGENDMPKKKKGK